jgi:hypothetical protein
MSAPLWSNVQVAVQSALATALPVSAVTKANPGVASYTGTDPSNGDYLYASSVQGMYQIDERVFRAANVNGAGNTVELEGENTTSYDTFTSGNLQVITFGTSLSTLVDLSATGGEPEQVDRTTIHVKRRRVQPGVQAAIVYSFTSLWDIADAGLIALKAASDVNAKRAFRFTFEDGKKMVFVGFVSTTLIPTGSAQGNTECNVTITMDGSPTYYTT